MEDYKEYRVVLTQTNVYHIEATDENEARKIATEETIWDEDVRYPDTYDWDVTVEECR